MQTLEALRRRYGDLEEVLTGRGQHGGTRAAGTRRQREELRAARNVEGMSIGMDVDGVK